MQVIVEVINKAQFSKVAGDKEFLNVLVILKAVKSVENDKEGKPIFKQYKLNVFQKYPETVAKWKPALKIGNVLDVHIQQNGVNVAPFEPFTVIKDVSQVKE